MPDFCYLCVSIEGTENRRNCVLSYFYQYANPGDEEAYNCAVESYCNAMNLL